MIDIFSTSDIEKVNSKMMLIDCNGIPALPLLSELRKYDGTNPSVIVHFKANPDFRDVVNASVKYIHKASLVSFVFFSSKGIYRAPSVAYLVSKELCALGNEIVLTHVRLPVPSEHMRPIKRTWGYEL